MNRGVLGRRKKKGWLGGTVCGVVFVKVKYSKDTSWGRFLESRAERKFHRDCSIQKENIRRSPFAKLFRLKKVRKSWPNGDPVQRHDREIDPWS